MSSFYIPQFKTEAGLQQNPAVISQFNTHCVQAGNRVKKIYAEVFLTWDGAAWVESAGYVPGAIVALRVDNPCAGTFAYLKIPVANFENKQKCCIDCPDLAFDNWALPAASPLTAYMADLLIPEMGGAGPYSITVLNKPDWMSIQVASGSGVVQFRGTPPITAAGSSVTVSLLIGSCGDEPAYPIEMEVYTDYGSLLATMRTVREEAGTFTLTVMGTGPYFIIVDNDPGQYRLMSGVATDVNLPVGEVYVRIFSPTPAKFIGLKAIGQQLNFFNFGYPAFSSSNGFKTLDLSGNVIPAANVGANIYSLDVEAVQTPSRSNGVSNFSGQTPPVTYADLDANDQIRYDHLTGTASWQVLLN